MLSTEQINLNKAFTNFFKEREISGYNGFIDIDVYNSIDKKVEDAIKKLENDELGKNMDEEAKEYILKKYQDNGDVQDVRSKRNRFFRYLFPTKTE